MTELSVIAPSYNEGINLSHFFAGIDDLAAAMECKKKIQIVLVDDGSTDATSATWGNFTSESFDFVYVRIDQNLGIYNALSKGLEFCTGDLICSIDADNQINSYQIVRLLKAYREQSCDFVRGVRSYLSSSGNIKNGQRGASQLLAQYVYGCRCSDPFTGVWLGSRLCFEDVLRGLASCLGPYRNFLFGLVAQARGYKSYACGVLVEVRQGPRSRLEKNYYRVSLGQLYSLVFNYHTINKLRTRDFDLEDLASAGRNSPHYAELSVARYLYAWIYFVTSPLHKWMITANSFYYYRLLRMTQYADRERQDAYQLKKLKKLVAYAYTNSIYYRERLDSLELKPSDIKTLDDINKLPMLSKSDLKSNLLWSLLPQHFDPKRILRISTSGSTGQPSMIFADRRQLEIRLATTFRCQEWCGWSWGDTQTRLWHQTIGMSRIQQVKEHIDRLALRRKFIPAFEINNSNISRIIRHIFSSNPVLVDGYAESFNLLARYWPSGFKPSNPFSIITSAQILPDEIRSFIEDRLCGKVYDKYGSREFSGIAYECGDGCGHVINSESYIIEIVRDGSPVSQNEVGEVLVTDLTNMVTPLLRYRIGDISSFVNPSSDNNTFRHSRRLGRIEGRTQAIVLCSNGTWLPGSFFGHFFKEYSHVIYQYQVIQHIDRSICVKLVVGSNAIEQSEHLSAILADLKTYTGHNQIIFFEIVDHIDMVRTGKRTPVISHLKYDFQKLGSFSESLE